VIIHQGLMIPWFLHCFMARIMCMWMIYYFCFAFSWAEEQRIIHMKRLLEVLLHSWEIKVVKNRRATRRRDLCSISARSGVIRRMRSGHYVKTSNRSHNICNRPLTPVTSTHICNSCYLVPVTYKRARTTPRLASTTPITNVDIW
jgi:hypothetical protein